MRIVVAGFITIDDIIIDKQEFTSLGGPPSYAGYSASLFNANVKVVSRVGQDFPDEYLKIFYSRNINLGNKYKSQTSLTTHFRIRIIKNERELKLIHRCEEPDEHELATDADALILNPVAGELGFSKIHNLILNFPVKYLDPQGYLRTFNSDGTVKLKRPSDISFIKYFSIIKVDEEEALTLTGINNLKEAANKLSNYSNGIILLTMGEKGVIIADKNNLFHIPTPDVNITENTGMGDILGGITVTEYVKSNDILWSVSLGVTGASLAGASNLNGINKVIHLDRNKVINMAHDIYEKYKRL